MVFKELRLRSLRNIKAWFSTIIRIQQNRTLGLVSFALLLPKMKFSLVLFTTLLSAVTALPSSPSNVEADVAVQHDIPPTEVAGGVTSADDPDTVSFSQSDSWEWGKRDGSEWSKRHADAELAKRALMTVVVYEGTCP